MLFLWKSISEKLYLFALPYSNVIPSVTYMLADTTKSAPTPYTNMWNGSTEPETENISVLIISIQLSSAFLIIAEYLSASPPPLLPVNSISSPSLSTSFSPRNSSLASISSVICLPISRIFCSVLSPLTFFQSNASSSSP